MISILRFALAIDLILLAYGVYKMGISALYDFEDEESFFIGTRIVITAVCVFVVLVALGILFSGGVE